MTQDQKERIWNVLTNRVNTLVDRDVSGFACPIALVKKGITVRVTQMHHRLPNTKVNRKCFPLFIDSMLNRIPVNGGWHMQYPSFAQIPPYRAMKYEKYLRRHPKIADYVNGKVDKLWM